MEGVREVFGLVLRLFQSTLFFLHFFSFLHLHLEFRLWEWKVYQRQPLSYHGEFLSLQVTDWPWNQPSSCPPSIWKSLFLSSAWLWSKFWPCLHLSVRVAIYFCLGIESMILLGCCYCFSRIVFVQSRYCSWSYFPDFCSQKKKKSKMEDHPLTLTFAWSICFARDRGFNIAVCDILSLPYRRQTFDACICIAVVHHLSTKVGCVCCVVNATGSCGSFWLVVGDARTIFQLRLCGLFIFVIIKFWSL